MIMPETFTQQTFTQHQGVIIPIDSANVDTDALLPKQYLASIKKSGYGNWLFDDVRYLDSGTVESDCSKRRLNPDFILNQAIYKDANIMIARENFGCGSSREHAVWALKDYGIKVVVAPSFASIFFDNCFKNNVLCIELKSEVIDMLFEKCHKIPGFKLNVNLEKQQITLPNNQTIDFEISINHKEKLLYGLDDIAVTLQEKEAILEYESRSKKQYPWLFDSFKNAG